MNIIELHDPYSDIKWYKDITLIKRSTDEGYWYHSLINHDYTIMIKPSIDQTGYWIFLYYKNNEIYHDYLCNGSIISAEEICISVFKVINAGFSNLIIKEHIKDGGLG